MSDDDLIELLADDPIDGEASSTPPPWRVLVVDDAPDVHQVTRLALGDIRYRGRRLELLEAHSAAAARQILSREAGIAIVLLDVVMETDDAGLKLVEWIREERKNHLVRIVLRTGQPGYAPERDVILKFDINDYKSKTELTSQKMFTTVIASLRAYDHLLALEAHRQGLEKIVQASATLMERRSMGLFGAGVLTEIAAVLGLSADAIVCLRQGDSKARDQHALFVLAACGRYERSIDHAAAEVLEPEVVAEIEATVSQRRSRFSHGSFTLFLTTRFERDAVVYVRTDHDISLMDRHLLEVFASNIAAGFDTVELFEQLKAAQLATVVALADVAEHRDTDTGGHVMRVARSTQAIANELQRQGPYRDQISPLFLELVGTASILHDVGKVSTPDQILRKPARLDPAEQVVMQRHAATGAVMLSRAATMATTPSYLSLGAEVAMNHHERWDGKGYPKGLAGTDIPLSARIVSVSDVFDALISRRPYKDPWPREEAIQFIKDGSGTLFDPVVVEAFLNVVDAEGLGFWEEPVKSQTEAAA